MSRDRRGSLAAQLQPRLVMIVAVTVILIAVATLVGGRAFLYQQLDNELNRTLTSWDRSSGKPGGQSPPGLNLPGMPYGAVITLALSDGRVLGGRVADGTLEEISSEAGLALDTLEADGSKHDVFLTDLGNFRAESRETTYGRVTIALSTHEADMTLRWMGLLALGLSIVAIGATAAITRRVLDTTTRPLVELTNTADQVSELELDRGEVEVPRVRISALPDRNEVTRLSLAFNQMLGRVENALTAREASESKLRRFVADASHELRNPLAAIRGYAELAQRSPASQDAAFAMGRIGAESERMSKLVNDLLLLARLDSDAPTQPERVDVVEVVLNAVSDAQASSRDHQWRLDVPDAEVPVMANSDQLQQVMVNLLGNARKHTPAGTTVWTSVRTDPGWVMIEVTDDGPGIPTAKQADVFERFTRLDQSRAHTSERSTGLGLAIVRAVVVGFGGQAWVDSRPGRTTFTVRLPYAGGGNAHETQALTEQ